MQRFLSKRSSSSTPPRSTTLRAERAAIALSVGLSWPPDRRRRSAGRPSWQQLWESALQEHILHHHELPHGVRLQRPAWWRPGETIDRPLTQNRPREKHTIAVGLWARPPVLLPCFDKQATAPSPPSLHPCSVKNLIDCGGDLASNTLLLHLRHRNCENEQWRDNQGVRQRYLEEWEPAHRGRHRAMLMQLQFPLPGDRGQPLEWKRLARQYEAQSSETLQDTVKTAILAHNPQDPEWRRHVGLNATRLQWYDALKSEWKAMHQEFRQWGITDGNDTTPMEVDALMKGKGKNMQRQGQREGQRQRQRKEQGQGEGRNIRHVECEVFLLQGERPRPKGLPQVLGLAR